MITIDRVDDAISRIQANIKLLTEQCGIDPQKVRGYIWRVASLCLTREGKTPEEAEAALVTLTIRLKEPINALLWQCDTEALAAIDKMLDKQVKDHEKSRPIANDNRDRGSAV